jgi:hypothetical protein
MVKRMLRLLGVGWKKKGKSYKSDIGARDSTIFL